AAFERELAPGRDYEPLQPPSLRARRLLAGERARRLRRGRCEPGVRGALRRGLVPAARLDDRLLDGNECQAAAEDLADERRIASGDGCRRGRQGRAAARAERLP